MNIYWIGRSPYLPTWDLQERLRRQVLAGGPESLLLCEHDPVITLGRGASPADVLADEASLAAQHIQLVRTSRGGQVTYHGPGQLVAYPIVRLTRGVLGHVVALGEAAVQVARDLGVPAAFARDRVGVFVGPRKLAAIGVHVRRRVTLHGLALNVGAQASAPFRAALFHPCGQPGAQVTSLAEERADLDDRPDRAGLPRPPVAVAELISPLSRALCQALRRPKADVVTISNESLLSSLPSVE